MNDDRALMAPPPAAERRRFLDAAVAGKPPEFFVPMPDGLAQLPVVHVPAGFLAYRVDNGRLIAELHEHTRKTGVTIAALRDTAASLTTQALLHQLLIAHATDQRGPIQPELRRLRQQTEPLLVSADGVVVNGNRRLSAMRSLLAEDDAAFACFAEIAVAVLPGDIPQADIEYIEAALQMAPETKLQYGWLNRRLKLRRQVEGLKLPRDWVVAAYQITDTDQLDRELAELALAEEYLVDRLGQPGHYAALSEGETLFAALNGQLRVLPSELRPVWQSIGFAMIAAQQNLDDTIGGIFPFVAPQPPHLPSLALRRFFHDKLRGGASEADDAQPEGDALLQDLRVFFDEARPEDVSALRDLISVMRDLREEMTEARRPASMLQRIRQARHQMDRLDPERLSAEQRNALRSEVAALLAQSNYLLGLTAETGYEQSKTTMVKAVSGYLKRWRTLTNSK